jgi:hypothetical protein
MFSSRKAITPAFNLMIAAVSAIIILLLLLLLLRSIGQKAEDQSEKARCKSSVTAYARLGELPLGRDVKDERSIDCPTKFVTIKKTTPRKMRTQIANLMVDCWDNYGEGKLMLFSPFSLESFCALCSVFQFQDKSMQLKGLPGFMMTEEAPIVRKDWHPTYQEFITGERSVEFMLDKAEGSADLSSLDGSKRYVVTYFTESSWIMRDVPATIIVAEYSEQGLKDMGCTALPVSMIDARFK